MNSKEEKTNMQSNSSSSVLQALFQGNFSIEVTPENMDNTEEEPQKEELNDKNTVVALEFEYVNMDSPVENQENNADINADDTPKKAKTVRKYKKSKIILEQEGPKIPRPPNSFMIYAQELRKKVSQECPGLKNKLISKMLGQSWMNLPQCFKKMYELRAQNAADEHKRRYPNYGNPYGSHPVPNPHQQYQPTAMMSGSVGVQTPVNYHHYYGHQQQQYQYSTTNNYQQYYHQQPPQQQQQYNRHHHQHNNHPQQSTFHQYLPPSSFPSASSAYVYNPQEARIRKAQRDQAKQAMRAQRNRKVSHSMSPELEYNTQSHPQPPVLLRHSRSLGTSPLMKMMQHQNNGTAGVETRDNRIQQQQHHSFTGHNSSSRFYQHHQENEGYNHHHHQQQQQHHQQLQHYQQYMQQYQQNNGSWYQYPQQQQHQSQYYTNQENGYGVHHGQYSMEYHNSSFNTPTEHPGLLSNGEDEQYQAMPTQAINQYELDNAVSSIQPKVEETAEDVSQTSSNPDSQPLPPFQHAFGSTEIGRFAHEGLSAQGEISHDEQI